MGGRSPSRATAIPLLVLLTIAGCAAIGAVAVYTSKPNVVMLTGIGVAGVVVIVLVYSAVLASRAAKAAGGPPVGPRGQ